MDILSIENLYEPLFQPLCEINDDDLWVEKGIAYGRCSAFPFLMKTYEELLENVDNLSDVEKNNIISRFYSLIKQLSVDYLVFFSYKRLPNIITPLKKVNTECVYNLVQKSMINLFIPELQIVCIGHDDFGFLVLSTDNNDKLEVLKQAIHKNSLHFLSVT